MPRWRRRIRSSLPFAGVCSGLAIVCLLYIFGLSHLQAARNSLFSPDDLYIPRLIDVAVVAWCVWIGSSIGSFLNVVAWRMPRGESINGRSHCPRCQSKLRARDNFPIFGWLRLSGRCHNCHLPIAARYPIVELTVGLSLTVIAIGQLYRLSLPGLAFAHPTGPLWAPRIDRAVLITLAFHVYAMTISWAFALVRFDGNRLPVSLVAFGLIPISLAILIVPPLAITSWRAISMDSVAIDLGMRGFSVQVDAVLRVLTALVAAALVGRSLAHGLCPAADPKLDPLGKSTRELMDVIAIIAVPSLIFGWQSVIGVVVIATMVAAILRVTLLRQTSVVGNFGIAVPIVSTIHLAFWTSLQRLWFWPTDQCVPYVILAWAAAILLTPLWLRAR